MMANGSFFFKKLFILEFFAFFYHPVNIYINEKQGNLETLKTQSLKATLWEVIFAFWAETDYLSE